MVILPGNCWEVRQAQHSSDK